MPVKSAKKAGDQHGARKKYNIFLYCVKYGSDYRPMQFHIWGEMIVGGCTTILITHQRTQCLQEQEGALLIEKLQSHPFYILQRKWSCIK